MINEHREKQLKSLMEAEFFDGFNRGRNEGYAVAERILLWFLTNPELKEPKSMVTLEESTSLSLSLNRRPMDKYLRAAACAIFKTIWKELAEKSKCDGYGGMECRRVFKEWKEAGMPVNTLYLKMFIIRQANTIPDFKES